jgi:hypothetical protein
MVSTRGGAPKEGKARGWSMSALGQKRTCAAHKLISALPPIATLIAFFGMSVLGQKAYLLIDRHKQNDRLDAVSPKSKSGFSLRRQRSAFCATNCPLYLVFCL